VATIVKLDDKKNSTVFQLRWPALVLALAIMLTPLGQWLESSMTSHVLIEMPLLIGIGLVFGCCVERKFSKLLFDFNAGGIAGVLIATFTLAFWMIPRWLDLSLTDPVVALGKYLSLIGLVGIPLAWSWSRMHVITRAVVKIEFLSMLFRIGWLYLIWPERLCNSYLLQDQVWLGWGFLLLGISLTISWLLPVFFGSPGVAGVYVSDTVELHQKAGSTME